MGDEPSRSVPLRASDADREAVVAELQEAAADGRIDLDELSERLEVALAARTLDGLAPLTADLLSVMPPAEPLVVKGGVAGAVRAGVWRVPARITASGGLGGAKLDFTRTECRLREVEIEVDGQAGGDRPPRRLGGRDGPGGPGTGRPAGQDDGREAAGLPSDPPDRHLRNGWSDGPSPQTRRTAQVAAREGLTGALPAPRRTDARPMRLFR